MTEKSGDILKTDIAEQKKELDVVKTMFDDFKEKDDLLEVIEFLGTIVPISKKEGVNLSSYNIPQAIEDAVAKKLYREAGETTFISQKDWMANSPNEIKQKVSDAGLITAKMIEIIGGCEEKDIKDVVKKAKNRLIVYSLVEPNELYKKVHNIDGLNKDKVEILFEGIQN